MDSLQSPHQYGEAQKSRKLRPTILGLLFLIVAVVAGVFGYLWNQERTKVATLDTQVGALTAQLDAAKTPIVDPGEPPISTTTQYKAVVGKFTLALPSDYVIIRNNDGGGEGGPSTFLSVGRQYSGNKDVVDYPTGVQPFTILAIDASKSKPADDFDEWVQTDLDAKNAESNAKLADVTIDGVKASSYKLPGLNDYQMLYFQKNNVWYQIEVGSVTKNSTSQKILAEVVKGLSFN